ncbi:Imm27 family immunity protein [Promicromonospora sp. NPDC050880]|uniref:Imm27 family immunity protein n=1 Tax=Promicromonospora sp. NPDC050880 TaxID=3364406 RepID=UPI0037902A70
MSGCRDVGMILPEGQLKCVCRSRDQFDGSVALEYRDRHLVRVSIDPQRWTLVYRCPGTGMIWILDYPESSSHGGGNPRLRQLTQMDG